MPKPLSLPFDPIARADELWKQRWGNVPSMAAITSIMRAQQILLAEVDAVVKPYGLTFARYEALVLLTFSKAGELPMSKIGERLMVHPTSVTNTVDRLVKSGLVARRPNPNDGRGTLATITEKGREAVDAATRDLMAMDFGLGVYDAEECAEIFAMLRPLRVAARTSRRSGRGVGGREPGGAGAAEDRRKPAVTLVRMKKSVLTRYRVMAYVTGVLLVLLTLGVFAKYVLDIKGADSFTSVVGIAHGWLYVVYLVFAFDLGSKAKWPVRRQLWVLLAGTIPTAAFFVERKVSHELAAQFAEPAPVAAQA